MSAAPDAGLPIALKKLSGRRALTIAGLVAAAVWGSCLALWHGEGRATLLDRVEAPLLDLRFLLAGPRPAPRDIVIVAIDDEAVKEAGAYPFPRPLVAKLVTALARHAPKVIALDILFIDPGPPEADRALADALRSARTVIAAAALFGREPDAAASASSVPDAPNAERLLWPVEPMHAAAAVGLVNVSTDHAGTPRHTPLIFRRDATLLPSFVLRTAAVAAGADPVIAGELITVGGVRTTTDLGLTLPLRFYGPRGAIRTVSAAEVLRGAIAADVLRDRILLVGATAVGTGDTFATPFDPVLPGIEVLATAVGHLVAGDGLVRSAASRRMDGIAGIVLAMASILLLAQRRLGVGIVLVALVAGLWTILATLAFGRGSWLHISVPLAALTPPALLYGVTRLWLDHRRELARETAQAAFRRFHAPAIAERLAAAPDFLQRPHQQHAAVLFLDLSGFTGLSERLGPGPTHEILKDFHSLVEDEVTRWKGLVVSFMGDGAMVVFGLPAPSPQDAAHAVEAALALADRVLRWVGDQPLARERRLGVRLGAHYGPVVVSRLGPETHQHITASGDSVNVASRLLEAADAHHAVVALSEDLCAAAGGHVASRERLGEPQDVAIRGRERHLQVRFWRAQAGP